MKLLITLTLLCVYTNGQAPQITDCTPLRLGSTGPPFSGNFPLCGDLGDDQCCTLEFLNNTAETRALAAFTTALTQELSDSREEYQQFLTRLIEYLGGRFVEGLTESFATASSLPFNVLSVIENQISASLITNLDIQANSDFNIDNFVSDILDSLSQGLSGVLSLVPGVQQCIQGILTGLVNSDVQALVDRSILIVRQSYTVLLRIQDFLLRLANPDFRPVQGCIEELARLSYCGRCTQRIPPLCRGTCSNVVRGCLSPIYTAYQSDFNRIWQYSRNIINNLKTNIADLFAEEGRIINNLESLSDTLSSECNIDIPNLPIGKRSASDEEMERDGVFDGLLGDLGDLNGFFNFDSDGPDFCEPTSSEKDYCSNENRDSTATRSCAVNSICVSECNCWDGTAMRATNTETFQGGNNVDNQALNPDVQGLTEELRSQYVQLQSNSQVSEFLASEEVTSVNPEGVTIPGSGAMVVVSMATMMLAVIVGLII